MRFLALFALGACLLAGCATGTGYSSNPEGAEADSGKTFTKEDALAAQPDRGAAIEARSNDGE
ncbi:MAG: hypothetical protein MH204_10610 [Fimbriimonadaceae bacterium]|nr:hypothetical protein [Fimbriimonadaceae bacterium]